MQKWHTILNTLKFHDPLYFQSQHVSIKGTRLSNGLVAVHIPDSMMTFIQCWVLIQTIVLVEIDLKLGLGVGLHD